MKCLVVTAHPLSNSLCCFLSDRIVDKLHVLGHDIYHEDLYVQGFNPLLSKDERESYYGTGYDFSRIEGQVSRLRESETIILLFPTWWFGFPAILKGWFDRVWGPGVAYDHADDFGPIKSRLDRLRNVLVITTLGAPWWVDRLLLRQPVKRVLKLAILGTCAKNSRLKFLSLYKSEKLNERQVSKFYGKIDRVMTNWLK